MLIKILDSKDDQFYFVIVAPNGEPLVTSEMYTTKAKCVYAANLIKNSTSKLTGTVTMYFLPSPKATKMNPETVWKIQDFTKKKPAIKKIKP